MLVGLGGLGDHVPGVTVYHAVDHAVEVVALSTGYAEWRRSSHTEAPASDLNRVAVGRQVARDLIGGDKERTGWLGAEEVSRLLRPYGLMTVGRLAENPWEATELADKLGFPVVVKVADRDIVHKTDRGLVRVGLDSAAEVIAAIRAFGRELDEEGVPVIVQPVAEGAEIALGVVVTPASGRSSWWPRAGSPPGSWTTVHFCCPLHATRRGTLDSLPAHMAAAGRLSRGPACRHRPPRAGLGGPG